MKNVSIEEYNQSIEDYNNLLDEHKTLFEVHETQTRQIKCMGVENNTLKNNVQETAGKMVLYTGLQKKIEIDATILLREIVDIQECDFLKVDIAVEYCEMEKYNLQLVTDLKIQIKQNELLGETEVQIMQEHQTLEQLVEDLKIQIQTNDSKACLDRQELENVHRNDTQQIVQENQTLEQLVADLKIQIQTNDSKACLDRQELENVHRNDIQQIVQENQTLEQLVADLKIQVQTNDSKMCLDRQELEDAYKNDTQQIVQENHALEQLVADLKIQVQRNDLKMCLDTDMVTELKTKIETHELTNTQIVQENHKLEILNSDLQCKYNASLQINVEREECICDLRQHISELEKKHKADSSTETCSMDDFEKELERIYPLDLENIQDENTDDEEDCKLETVQDSIPLADSVILLEETNVCDEFDTQEAMSDSTTMTDFDAQKDCENTMQEPRVNEDVSFSVLSSETSQHVYRKNKYKEIEKQVNSLEHTIECLNQNINMIVNEKMNLLEMLENSKTECADMRVKTAEMSNLQNKCQEIEKQVNSLEHTIECLNQNINMIVNEKMNLLEMLENSKTECADMRVKTAEMSTLKHEVVFLRDMMTVLDVIQTPEAETSAIVLLQHIETKYGRDLHKIHDVLDCVNKCNEYQVQLQDSGQELQNMTLNLERLNIDFKNYMVENEQHKIENLRFKDLVLKNEENETQLAQTKRELHQTLQTLNHFTSTRMNLTDAVVKSEISRLMLCFREIEKKEMTELEFEITNKKKILQEQEHLLTVTNENIEKKSTELHNISEDICTSIKERDLNIGLYTTTKEKIDKINVKYTEMTNEMDLLRLEQTNMQVLLSTRQKLESDIDNFRIIMQTYSDEHKNGDLEKIGINEVINMLEFHIRWLENWIHSDLSHHIREIHSVVLDSTVLM